MKLLSKSTHVGLWPLLVLETEGHSTQIFALLEYPLLRTLATKHIHILKESEVMMSVFNSLIIFIHDRDFHDKFYLKD